MKCCAEHEHTVATHPCEWAHEGETCTYSAFKFFPGAYLRALPVYLPVYVLPAILVHRYILSSSACHSDSVICTLSAASCSVCDSAATECLCLSKRGMVCFTMLSCWLHLRRKSAVPSLCPAMVARLASPCWSE